MRPGGHGFPIDNNVGTLFTPRTRAALSSAINCSVPSLSANSWSSRPASRPLSAPILFSYINLSDILRIDEVSTEQPLHYCILHAFSPNQMSLWASNVFGILRMRSKRNSTPSSSPAAANPGFPFLRTNEAAELPCPVGLPIHALFRRVWVELEGPPADRYIWPIQKS